MSSPSGVEFMTLEETSDGLVPEARQGSFSGMLGRIVQAFDPPLSPTISNHQHGLIALAGEGSVGLSIIEPEGSVGFDTLTWVDPSWRRFGSATALKLQAFQSVGRAGITALWAPGDARSASFYRALGNWSGRGSHELTFPNVFEVSPIKTERLHIHRKDTNMSVEENKAIVGRWFTEFWGNPWNPDVIDEVAHPDIRFEYSLHQPMRGRDEVREFATKFRTAFPDLNFWGTADLIAEGDYVVGQWEGGGTHTGPIVFDDLPIGSVTAASGKTLRFTGTTVLKVQNGLIVEELGLDDGVKVLQQLGIIPTA